MAGKTVSPKWRGKRGNEKDGVEGIIIPHISEQKVGFDWFLTEKETRGQLLPTCFVNTLPKFKT